MHVQMICAEGLHMCNNLCRGSVNVQMNAIEMIL